MVYDELNPYFLKRRDLSIEENSIMWGHRLIIPLQLQKEILKQLHGSHFRIVKMKSIVHSYFWWPGIDKNIEEMCKSCTACLTTTKLPNKAELIP